MRSWPSWTVLPRLAVLVVLAEAGGRLPVGEGGETRGVGRVVASPQRFRESVLGSALPVA